MEHLLQLFISSVMKSGDAPFVYERHAKMYVSALEKEVAAEVNSFSRALHMIGVSEDARVAFCGLQPSKALLISQFATLSIRAAAVVIPASFPAGECVGVLAETRSKVALVETLSMANTLAQARGLLPELTHVICLDGKADTALPILHWKSFADSGKMQPDRTAESLAAIKPTETAMLFYSREEGKAHKATRYSHGQLLEHARTIEKLMGVAHAIHKGDIVVTSPVWEQPVEHIASCFLPILRDASIQVNEDPVGFACLENHPQVLVAPAAYLEKLRAHIEQNIKESGRLEWSMLQKSLAYGKRKYESADKIGLLRKFFDMALKATVVRKVTNLLGGRLRLIIGVDDAASYETQLFFHTFGVDLVEIPSEMFRVE